MGRSRMKDGGTTISRECRPTQALPPTTAAGRSGDGENDNCERRESWPLNPYHITPDEA